MIKEENWGIPMTRAVEFWNSQNDVEKTPTGFLYHDTTISLMSEVRNSPFGTQQRTILRMEGPKEELETIYHRFFIRFLSAGG